MDFIGALILAMCGVLCIPSIIKNGKPMVLGIAGIIACLFGIFGLIYWIFNTGFFYSFGPKGFISWISSLVTNGLIVATGFLLTFDVMKPRALKGSGDDAVRAADSIHAKIAGVRAPLGIAAVVIGCWTFLFSIIYHFIWR